MGATEEEKAQMVDYFKHNTVSNASVKEAMEKIRAK
jgi:hydroxymethylglutaryl-CoA reductase